MMMWSPSTGGICQFRNDNYTVYCLEQYTAHATASQYPQHLHQLNTRSQGRVNLVADGQLAGNSDTENVDK